MNQPVITCIAERGATSSDAISTIDVLVSIDAGPRATDEQRPPLNLAFVIDRSGSMQGHKLQRAVEAASFALSVMLPTDRASITVFDQTVSTLVRNRPVTDRDFFLQTLRGISFGGGTALHAGWQAGGIEACNGLNPGVVSRVLLLTDGLANVGVQEPHAICEDVLSLRQKGVGTTTMGVGPDYHEDLLEAMARTGDGNFYHIRHPEQLPGVFDRELQGLSGTRGVGVRLAARPARGVQILECLNDLDLDASGYWKLPTLVAGNPLTVVLRVQVNGPERHAVPGPFLSLRLEWETPDDQGQRHSIDHEFAIPLVASAALDEFPVNETVREQVALLYLARSQQEVIHSIDRRDYTSTENNLRRLLDHMLHMSPTPERDREIERLQIMLGDIARHDYRSARKEARISSYERFSSRASFRERCQ